MLLCLRLENVQYLGHVYSEADILFSESRFHYRNKIMAIGSDSKHIAMTE